MVAGKKIQGMLRERAEVIYVKNKGSNKLRERRLA